MERRSLLSLSDRHPPEQVPQVLRQRDRQEGRQTAWKHRRSGDGDRSSQQTQSARKAAGGEANEWGGLSLTSAPHARPGSVLFTLEVRRKATGDLSSR